MSHTPPLLPPAKNNKGNAAVPPPPPSQIVNTSHQQQGDTVQPPNNYHPEDVDYEVVSPKKSNPWLWAIPAAIILLLAGGGVYAYFYMEQKHEDERADMLAEQEAEELARKEREQERLDSIARQDSLRLNFTSPDLAMFNLKGHVKSVMTNHDSDVSNYSIMMKLFDNKPISFDYDGNCTSIASELKVSANSITPSISRGGDYITNVDFNYNVDTSDNYTFTWSGDRITYAKNEYFNGIKGFDGSYRDNYTDFDGNDPTSISQNHTYSSCDAYFNTSKKHNLTFTITYTDRDEYGNWTKAQVNVTGTETREWTEEEERENWNGYEWYTYTVEVPKSETNNINSSYTITRYIYYHEYVPSEY